MAKYIGIFGVFAFISVVVDIVHGQHNGDTHRYFIHIAEFIFFFVFLCLLEVWGFRTISKRFNVNRWWIAAIYSILNCVLGLLLFLMSGGSFHGDGGPIAFSFLAIELIAYIAFPISLIGLLVVSIVRQREGIPILAR